MTLLNNSPNYLPNRGAPSRWWPWSVLCGVAMVLVSVLGQFLGVAVRPAAALPTGDGDPVRTPPISGSVLRGFQIGEHDWLPGHRGIDLAGRAGQSVLAAAAGTVSWVGTIAGVPMLTVQHPDGLRTTYQPVEALVPSGATVAAGQPIAVLVDGHCATQACLHFGLRDGEVYLDPLAWLGGLATGEVRLLPRSAVPRQQPPPGWADSEVDPLVAGELPVAGPITSGFGARASPMTGAAEFHDGVDIGAACGTPVRTRRPGVVSFAGSQGGYGWRVEIDHGVLEGVRLTSSYSHLSSFGVDVGQQVQAGSSIGLVGSTGWSTGCHLHYGATLDGRAVDPLTVPT